MADFEWLKRTVDTAGRPCPLRLADKCPGERSGCAFWLDEIVESDGRQRPMSGCLFAFNYVQQHAVVVESVRTQAGIDKAATVLRQAGGALVAAAIGGHRELAR